MKTVRARLLAGFGVVILSLVGLIAGSLYLAHRTSVQSQAMAEVAMVNLEGLSELESSALRQAVNVRDLALNDDMKIQEALMAESKQLTQVTQDRLKQALQSAADDATRQKLEQIAAQMKSSAGALAEVSVAADEGRADDAKHLVLTKVRPAQQALSKSLHELMQTTLHQTQQIAQAEAQASTTQIYATLAVALLTVLAALGIALWLSARITGELGGEPADAVAAANAIAEGNLTSRITVMQGNPHSLMAALQNMQASLADLVSGVRQASEGVAQASTQIAQGNLDLSTRTEEQASALQQTAASMDQLGSTVRGTAENAEQANQLAASASSVANRGGEMVKGVVQTMHDISTSSKKISDIIGVIDGIAFQTNILALNAAVEAARAGEQGRGFAVVASEVRNLAGRSADAAREIKALISNSVERVEDGAKLVELAGGTMTEVVTSIGRVANFMDEISCATKEQTQGVSQVCEAVSQMDKTTQQNAALVEQSSAAAEALRQQAQHLVAAVAVFKTSR